MKKTIFFVTSLNSGGIENYLLRFLSFYDGKITPIVICKSGEFGDLEDAYRKIQNIQLIKMKLGYFNPLTYYNLYKYLKNNKVESVCDFTGNFAGLALLTSKFNGINRRLSFYRGATNHFEESKIKLYYNKLMNLLVNKNATKILSNSKAALDYFYSDRAGNDNRFKVIYNGIDAAKFNTVGNVYSKKDFNIPENAFLIGHTGRFNAAKNHKTILDVAEIICKKYDNVFFLFCGKDTDVYLKEQVSNNQILKDKVKILGYRDDVNKILPVSNLFFFPSITEGQPNALIEAMIVGLPIVASNIEPIKETTPKQLHNELLDPLDVVGFVKRIEEYYLNEEKRKENNYSEWAKKKFNPYILFNQFYKEL